MYRVVLFLLSTNNIICCVPTFESMPPEIIEHILVAAHQTNKVCMVIPILLDQRRVNRVFNEAIVYSSTWHTIFSALEKKGSYLTFLTSHGSLSPESPIGRKFFSFLISPDYYRSMLNTRLFMGIISKNHSIKDQGQITKQYDKNTRNDKRRLMVERMACLFKACCVKKIRLDQLLQIDRYATIINNTDVIRWIEDIVPKIRSMFPCYNNNIEKAHVWLYQKGGTLLMHWALVYHAQNASVQKENNVFEQNDIIRACRLNDNASVNKLLKQNNKHSLQHRDVLHCNALLVSIINHHHDIFTMLVDAMTISRKESEEYIKFSACVSNNYAFQKLVTKYYKKVFSFEHWLPFSVGSKRFLDDLMIFLARLQNNNTETFKILLKRGVSIYVKCDLCGAPLVQIANQGGYKKLLYAQDYIHSH